MSLLNPNTSVAVAPAPIVGRCAQIEEIVAVLYDPAAVVTWLYSPLDETVAKLSVVSCDVIPIWDVSAVVIEFTHNALDATGATPIPTYAARRPPLNVAADPFSVPVNVGDAENTSEPVPVSSVTAAARFALLGVLRNVAMPAPRLLSPVPPFAADNGLESVSPANVGLAACLTL
jgi:hypothetical protein